MKVQRDAQRVFDRGQLAGRQALDSRPQPRLVDRTDLIRARTAWLMNALIPFGGRSLFSRSRHVVRGAACMLATRYEEIMPVWWRYLALEDRFPAVARAIDEARRGHTGWLAEAFAPHLPTGRGTKQALAALVAATEIYVWRTWRTHLGLTAAEAERTLGDMLEALVVHWGSRSRRKT